MVKVYRSIILANAQLHGAYKLEEVFQLLPFTSEFAPTINEYVCAFPIFLEYTVDSDNQDIVNREHEILDVLSALSQYSFYKEDIHRGNWGIQYPLFLVTWEELEENERIKMLNSKSAFYYPIFYYPEIGKDLNCNGFTDISMMPYVEENHIRRYKYEMNDLVRPDLTTKLVIQFDESLKECLSAYFNAIPEIKDDLLSIFHLISSTLKLGDFKDSISFLTLVSAIEGMVLLDKKINSNIKEDIKVCEHCHRPYSTIKKDFESFLVKYGAEYERDLKIIKKIYQLRCKISHSAFVFLSDKTLFSKNKQKTNELLWHTLSFARKTTANWLIANGPKILQKCKYPPGPNTDYTTL